MTQRNVLQIESLEGATLLKLFDNLDRKIEGIKVSPGNQEPETFMTRQEVADLYKITIPTTYAWERAGIFKSYKIANKTRFLRAEVMAAAKGVSSKGGNQ
jgi:hypothetical protein